MRRRRDEGRRAAELAALADGSLAPERRADARSARSPRRPSSPTRSPSSSARVALARRTPRPRSRRRPALRARVEAQRRTPARRRRAAPARRRRSSAGRGRRGRRGDRPVVGSGTSSEQLPAPRSEPRASRPARAGRDAHEDDLRLADRARRERAAPARQRPVLRGLAEERGGRARPDRDVQRGPEASRSGRACRRRSFTTLTVTRERADGDQASSGAEGARRDRRAGADPLRPSRPRSRGRPAAARGRAGS